MRFVKSQQLAWLGHMEWMGEERMPRKLLHGRIEGRRRCRRPRKIATEPGGGSEDHVGQKIVGEGGV
jgi:hypothetical protein